MVITRIFLADDHPVVRRGLRALLEGEPHFRVVGESGDGLETVRLVGELKPDVLILDLKMPGLNGLEVTRRVKRVSPLTRVIILSIYGDKNHVIEAFKSGAWGYVLKEANVDELIRAVKQVIAGRRYLCQSLSELVIDYISSGEGKAEDPYELLTPREREILYLVAQGMTNSEIASKLYISRRTVETHRANLMRKLGLKNQAELIRFAIRRGILPLE